MKSPVPAPALGAVRDLYDRIAPEYDGRYVSPYDRIYDAVTWDHLDRLLAQVPKDAPLLDVAAGTGFVTLELLRRGFTDITAVDLSPSMLGVLDRRAREIPQGPDRLRIRVEDFHDLSALPEERFAAVFCQGSALSCTLDFRTAAREMRRRVLPGGWLNLSVHNRLGSVEKILHQGSPEDLAPALEEGRWHWYEDGERIHEMYLFCPEDWEDLTAELGLVVERHIGKLVLSRSFVASLSPDSSRFRTARKFALKHSDHPQLRWRAEYSDLVLRAL